MTVKSMQTEKNVAKFAHQFSQIKEVTEKEESKPLDFDRRNTRKKTLSMRKMIPRAFNKSKVTQQQSD